MYYLAVVTGVKEYGKLNPINLLNISIYLLISSVAEGEKGSDRSESRCLGKMQICNRISTLKGDFIFQSISKRF